MTRITIPGESYSVRLTDAERLIVDLLADSDTQYRDILTHRSLLAGLPRLLELGIVYRDGRGWLHLAPEARREIESTHAVPVASGVAPDEGGPTE